MLRLSPAALELGPVSRWALDVLVDQSRVLVVEDPTADVVTLDVGDRDQVTDGRITVATSALADVANVAGAETERQSSARDRHGRVPSSANPLAATGRERRPVITEAAVALQQSVRQAAGRRCVRLIAPWPDGKRWAAAFTHDVDVVAGWAVFTALRLAELLRKGEFGRAARVTAAALGAASLGDPAWRGMRDVLAREKDTGVPSTWFLLCGTPTVSTWRAGDLTYIPESRAVGRLLDALATAGNEVGLHGSFATYESAEVFAEQRHRLSHLVGAVSGVRQHYLRMRPGPTQAAMRQAGFAYDATFGFPDRNGFRLGVADVVPSRVEGLDEVPLVWMDRALSKYRGIEDPAAWVDDALELAATARAVDGLWVGLWHCNLTPPLGYPGAPEAYGRLLAEITRQDPYVATLDRLVAWRRARRSVRARTVAPDGRCELTDPTIRLE